MHSLFIKLRSNNILRLALNRKFCTVGNNTTEEGKFDYVPPKKQIFNKKTHFRNLEVDNKLDPPKSFEEADEKELMYAEKRKLYPKEYLKINDDWQKNLMKKKKKKAKTKMLLENYVSL